MCGIFGIIGKEIAAKEIRILSTHARQRGKDSSGIAQFYDYAYHISRADFDINYLLRKTKIQTSNFLIGHSRLITNGFSENQPVIRDNIILLHNGIILNEDSLWKNLSIKKKYEIDSEIIIGMSIQHLKDSKPLSTLSAEIFSKCLGIVSIVLAFPELGKLLLMSNNGSLYIGKKNKKILFCSEKFPLVKLKASEIEQINQNFKIIDIDKSSRNIEINDHLRSRVDLIPSVVLINSEKNLLVDSSPNLKRCKKCILPETMPYIRFDSDGVCNYCHYYRVRNQSKPSKNLLELLENYRKDNEIKAIVPFSGGRDSSFGLHLLVKEFGLKPVAFTYDWGMVTDIARRNISLMCSKLEVENIVVAADIEKKRSNIAKNLQSWLKSPHLGMLSILTAGDKHFYRYIQSVKRQTEIDLNLWSINPLEITHFKSGFLRIQPDFDDTSVYARGIGRQLRYQAKRLKAMSKSLGYFNSSILDTLSGEFYRSIKPKNHYFHVFDYWQWDEREIDKTLESYGWERALDTPTTWRIGDGTAAFYNYVYYTVAGFTEHDTFRSNQIREGQISRDHALTLVAEENRPRYQNIKWYLNTLNFDFKSTISTINKIPRLF